MADLPPGVFHHARTFKRSDSRPTLEMQVPGELEAAEAERDGDHEHSYDESEFADATRIELHADYYREEAGEFVRIVDGREAIYDDTNDIVEFDLDRVDTSRVGNYRFEWLLIYDDPDATTGEVPTGDVADQVNTVPVEGYYGYRVTAPTQRDLETVGAEPRSVGDLTVSGTLSNESGGSVTLGDDPLDPLQASTKRYTDDLVSGVATDLTTHTNATQAHGSNGNIAGVGDIETHRTDAVHAQPQPPVAHDHTGDHLIPDTVQQGVDRAETVTEATSPASFTFSAGEFRDILEVADVTLSNATAASVTEDVTVDLHDGPDATAPVIATDTQSVTVAAGGSATTSFLTDDISLGAGNYHIEVGQSGVDLSIDETVIYTIGGEYTWSQDEVGDSVITDHRGRERARFDAIENRTTFPGGIETSEGLIDSAQVDNLHTDSRVQSVQIWTDGSTIFADGPTGIIDSGSDFATVVQSAVDSLGSAYGGLIYIPAGIWSVSQTITLPGRVQLVGAGIESTILELADGVTADMINYHAPDGVEYYFAGVHKMKLAGMGNGGRGIAVTRAGAGEANDFHCSEVFVHRFASHGIHIEYGWGAHIDHVLIETCANDALVLEGNQHYISDMFIAYNQGDGLYSLANRVKATNLRIHNNDGRGVDSNSSHYFMLANSIITNSGTGTNNLSGLRFAFCREPQVSNVLVDDNQTTPTQRFGLWLRGINADEAAVVTGCVFRNNVDNDLFIDSNVAESRLGNVDYDTVNNNGDRIVINGVSSQAATPGGGAVGDVWGGNEALANRWGAVVEDTSVTAPYAMYRADSANNWVQIG